MKSTGDTLNDVPIVLFEEQGAWAAWLEENHATSPGLWLRLAKKAAELESLSYAEALEVALCYGWIDGQEGGDAGPAYSAVYRDAGEEGKALPVVEDAENVPRRHGGHRVFSCNNPQILQLHRVTQSGHRDSA